VVPLTALACALATQSTISEPYGGFIHTLPAHSWASPSSSGVKYRSHFALLGSAQTSSVN
jgi:hypothetical protein